MNGVDHCKSNSNDMHKLQCEDMATSPDASHFYCSDFSHPAEWLDALSTDKVETATTILRDASANYKDFLMNGDIPTSHRHLQNSRRSNMEFCITKPLHAAAIFHSHAVLRLLWESGADVLQVDSWQNNVVHMLIFADYCENAGEAKYEKTLVFLQGLFSEGELKSLLMAENNFSLRPLEFAALQGCLCLAGVIMETKGVYLLMEEHVGYSVVQYFDVSDYESYDDVMPPRCFKSPLTFLVLAETSRIKTIASSEVFNDAGLRSWINAKTMMNWPFVMIWFLFRLCYIMLFFLASMDNSWPVLANNFSDHNGNNTEEMIICSSQPSNVGVYLRYILVSLSVLILMYDIYDHIFFRKLFNPGLYKWLQGRDYIARVMFFHYVQSVTCLSVVGMCVCQILRSEGFDVPLTVDHIFFVVVASGCMWGVLYFLQVLPWISIYAIAIQRMLQDFVRFTLIFVIFLCAFAISFRRILLEPSNECPAHFGTFGETIYSTFLVVINLVNFQEYENVDKTSLYLLHVVFVFFISILLLNFLIATMTQSFSEVYTHRRTITQTQRLALMMTVHFRLARPMRAYYKKLQRNVYVYHNNRLCLRRVLIKGKNLGPILFILE